MAVLTDFLENKLVDHVFRNVSYTPPTTVYVALFTTATTDAGGGTEVTGGAYARQAIACTVPSNGATSNTADINFPVATADWGIITHIALCDAATLGNMLVHGAATTNKTIQSSDQYIIRAGELDLTFD